MAAPYEQGVWTDYDPRGVAVDLGITTAMAQMIIDDLSAGGEIKVTTSGGGPSLLMQRPGVDLISDKSTKIATRVEELIDVFLSHSAVDDTLCGQVAAILNLWGISTFHTPTDIPTGYWHPQIETALQSSTHIAVLLTPTALNKSIWVHQEFGYFLGFKSQTIGAESQHRVHYFLDRSTDRPGMYGQIQANEVADLSQPLLLAQEIAVAIGKPVGTQDVGRFATQVIVTSATLSTPPRSEEFSLGGFSASSNQPKYTEMYGEITLTPPTRIFRAGICGWAQNIEIEDTTSTDHIQAGRPGKITYTVRRNDDQSERPVQFIDRHGIVFPYARPMDPGKEFEPLYLTFQFPDQSCWAAVMYFKLADHAKGYPRLEIEEPGAIYGWVEGQPELDSA